MGINISKKVFSKFDNVAVSTEKSEFLPTSFEKGFNKSLVIQPLSFSPVKPKVESRISFLKYADTDPEKYFQNTIRSRNIADAFKFWTKKSSTF